MFPLTLTAFDYFFSKALKNEIKDMHGIRIFTELPANSNVDQSAK